MSRKPGDEPFVVIVGMDYSGVSHLALSDAFRLVQLRPSSELHVVHVDSKIQPNPLSDRSSEEERGFALERLERLIAGELEILKHHSVLAPDRTSVPITPHVRTGRAGREIAQLAVDLLADLIVVGTHGRTGISRLLLGSVAHAVVTLAPCPVLVVRPKDGTAWSAELEPPCAACCNARSQSARETLWCDAHREYHGQRFTRAQPNSAPAEPANRH